MNGNNGFPPASHHNQINNFDAFLYAAMVYYQCPLILQENI